MKIDKRKINRLIGKYKGDRGALIQVLQDMMIEYKYLPREALEHVSERLGVSLSRVYHVATFYNAFSLVPKGEHQINVCVGTACHVRGAHMILDKFERDLKINSGQTTKDQQFSLDTVACVGACALGPIVVVDGESHGHMNQAKVDQVLKKFKSN